MKQFSFHCRDHTFDRRVKTHKVVTAKVMNPFGQPKGVMPVRKFYKTDESKMLWSSRLRVDVESMSKYILCII